MKEEQIKNTVNNMLKQFQTVVTISYIFAVGIGMLFEYQKYDEFGINIFDYSDVFDFLLAPFADTKIFLFTIIALGVPYISYRFDFEWKTRFPNSYTKFNFGVDKKSWYDTYRFTVFGIVLISYFYFTSNTYGALSKQKTLEEDDVILRFSDNEVKKGKMIGQTYSTIFLLVDERVQIVPYSAVIKEIEIGKLKTEKNSDKEETNK